MQITELLPELITALAPTGPQPLEPATQLAYWRQLVTKRQPGNLPQGYLAKEDQLLELLHKKRPVLTLDQLTETWPGLYLVQADLTQLKVDAIVNDSADHMLGCFEPEQLCLDNKIHVLAGSRLREECAQMMQQTTATPGQARITAGYHLPAKHVIHALAPTVHGQVTALQQEQLRACYHASLTLALEHNLTSLAFCCLGTGRRKFPSPLAAQIALEVAQEFLQTHPEFKIVFCTYKDIDHNLYQYLLHDH